ncbi:MAG: tetratricopeptide repeat protein [Planctomycetes bacterium]|nr:tetratricopeptide repeat protein [Planctomycetota bacterium]
MIAVLVALATLGYSIAAKERRGAPVLLEKARGLLPQDPETALKLLGEALYVPIAEEYDAPEDARTGFEVAKCILTALRRYEVETSPVRSLGEALEPIRETGGKAPKALLEQVKKMIARPELLTRRWEAAEQAARAGDEALIRGDFESALREFNDAIRMAPLNVEAWVGRAAAHLALGRMASAADDFTRAIELDPWQPECFLGRAKGAVERRDFEAALREVDRALQIAPDLMDARALRDEIARRRREAETTERTG